VVSGYPKPWYPDTHFEASSWKIFGLGIRIPKNLVSGYPVLGTLLENALTWYPDTQNPGIRIPFTKTGPEDIFTHGIRIPKNWYPDILQNYAEKPRNHCSYWFFFIFKQQLNTHELIN
jgi:hypothetical protein